MQIACGSIIQPETAYARYNQNEWMNEMNFIVITKKGKNALSKKEKKNVETKDKPL